MDNKDLVRIGCLILAGIVLLYLVNNYSTNKNNTSEEFSSDSSSDSERVEVSTSDNQVSPGEELGKNEIFNKVDSNTAGEFNLGGNQYPNDCFPKDQLTPADLLPSDANSKWAEVNPAGQGELGDQNFLEAGYHVGVNTVGQTLRNANLQLRSEPPNPQVKVSPWLQSTIEPDTNRKPMEIGGCE